MQNGRFFWRYNISKMNSVLTECKFPRRLLNDGHLNVTRNVATDKAGTTKKEITGLK